MPRVPRISGRIVERDGLTRVGSWFGRPTAATASTASRHAICRVERIGGDCRGAYRAESRPFSRKRAADCRYKMCHSVTRPLLIIFLTILVNLIGFGIIIPLLPFYAETFGASPVAIGLLFAVFSLCQLIAAPALGDLSDRQGRRPVLIFSLLGTVVSFVMLALAQTLT